MAEENKQDDPLDIQEFTAHVAKKFCPWCGTPITDSGKGRPRTFCCTRCRWAFEQYRYRKKKKKQKLEEIKKGTDKSHDV